jgi:hypothetical protein
VRLGVGFAVVSAPCSRSRPRASTRVGVCVKNDSGVGARRVAGSPSTMRHVRVAGPFAALLVRIPRGFGPAVVVERIPAVETLGVDSVQSAPTRPFDNIAIAI